MAPDRSAALLQSRGGRDRDLSAEPSSDCRSNKLTRACPPEIVCHWRLRSLKQGLTRYDPEAIPAILASAPNNFLYRLFCPEFELLCGVKQGGVLERHAQRRRQPCYCKRKSLQTRCGQGFDPPTPGSDPKVLPLGKGPPWFQLGPVVSPNQPNPLQVPLRGDSRAISALSQSPRGTFPQRQ